MSIAIRKAMGSDLDSIVRLQLEATILMCEAEKWILSSSISTIDLIVWASNEPAKSLFAEQGFVALETRMAKKLV